MNQFTDPPVQVLSQTIFEGTPTTLKIAFNVSMDNRSPVQIDNMGTLNFSMIVRGPGCSPRLACVCVLTACVRSLSVSLSVWMQVDGVPVGFAVSDGAFRMAEGLGITSWIAYINRDASNHAQIDALVGSYANGDIQQVSLHGHANSTTIESLRPALMNVQMNTTMQGLVHMEDKLIQMVYTFMDIPPLTNATSCNYNDTTPAVGANYQDVYMYVHNPFAAEISVDDIDFNVWWTAQSTQNTSFMAHARGRNLNQVVPPGQRLPPRCVAMARRLGHVMCLCVCVLLTQAALLCSCSGFACLQTPRLAWPCLPTCMPTWTTPACSHGT